MFNHQPIYPSLLLGTMGKKIKIKKFAEVCKLGEPLGHGLYQNQTYSWLHLVCPYFGKVHSLIVLPYTYFPFLMSKTANHEFFFFHKARIVI
jgi:hypothetical protein